MTQHKWHKEIKAWADGAEIEYRSFSLNKGNTEWTNWMSTSRIASFYEDGDFGHNYEYRIKPPQQQPQYLYVYDTGLPAVALSTQKDLERYELIGKIKLEVEE